jgi:hypothetical protein
MKEVRSGILARVGEAQYRATWRQVVTQFRAATAAPRDVISGKDYLLPLLHLRLRRIFALRDSVEQLKARLARHTDLDVDPEFFAAVRAA